MSNFITFLVIVALCGCAYLLVRNAVRQMRANQERESNFDKNLKLADDWEARTTRVKTGDVRYTGKAKIYRSEGQEVIVYERLAPSGAVTETTQKPSDHPTSIYFDSFEKIEDLKRWEEYEQAFQVAMRAVEAIPAVVDDWIREIGEPIPNPGPPLGYACTYLTIHGDQEGLARIGQILSQRKQLEDWGSVFDEAKKDLETFQQIKYLIEQEPGVIQKTIYKTLRVSGHRGSSLLYWADKFGLIRREKSGNSYRLYLR